jgi:hypothetical protein
MSRRDTLTTDRFLKEVATHEMEVIRDDGIYRHLHFAKPGTMYMHFDLITWPGYLCYTGDMGTYVFTRVRDMFTFFRRDGDEGADLFRWIDRRYWAEKVEAADKADGIKEFSEEIFTRNVMEHLVGWIHENRDRTTKDERRELWDEVVSEVVQLDDDSQGSRRQAAAHDFSHKVSHAAGTFWFRDFFEHDNTDFTLRFTWCCYALRWGINQYDQAKASAKSSIQEAADAIV